MGRPGSEPGSEPGSHGRTFVRGECLPPRLENLEAVPRMTPDLFTRTGRPRHNTVEVWTGPSRIEGSPLVVLVTGLRGSSNSKTGSVGASIRRSPTTAQRGPSDRVM